MNLSPLPIQKFFDNNGNPLVGGLLFTYIAGTTTKIATYTDSTGGATNTNPIVLNFRGEANVWLDPTLTYKFVLAPAGDTDPPTRPIWTVDQITSGISYANLVTLITQTFIGAILYPRTAAEIAAGVTPTFYYYPPGYFRRYGGSTAAAASANRTAMQAALDSNTEVVIDVAGTYNFDDSLLMNNSNFISGTGFDTILKWNVTNKSLIKGKTKGTLRQYYWGLRDLWIDNTSRANANAIAVDVSENTSGLFENVTAANVATGWFASSAGFGAGGALQCAFYRCATSNTVTAANFGTLSNEFKFFDFRIADTTDGAILNDNTGHKFYAFQCEAFTGTAVTIGNTAASIYHGFYGVRLENASAGASIGFNLNVVDSRVVVIVGPVTYINVFNLMSAIGDDTLLMDPSINSPEIRTNRLALGDGGITNNTRALLKANGASDVHVRNAADAGFADITASDIYANRYMRVSGASAGAASTTTLGNGTASTVGAAGGASALPATPLGYIICHVGTTQVKVPYYSV